MDVQRECNTHGFTSFKPWRKWYRCRKCMSDAVARRRKKLKQLAVEYKGGKCSICGYSKCIAALEFHHLNPLEKDFGISASGETRSWEKVKAELDKCIIVCSNCHREIHDQESKM